MTTLNTLNTINANNTNVNTVLEIVDRIVDQNIIACVSSMFSEVYRIVSLGCIGNSYNGYIESDTGAGELWEQCSNLMQSEPDYEEAAKNEGWFINSDGNFEDASINEVGDYDNWKELCFHEGVDTDDYRSEVFEHWIVSDWIASKLIEHGEVVDTDFMGLTIWGRTTTGQSISMDCVIQQIAKDLAK